MPSRAFPIIIIVAVILLAAMMSVFTVKESQLAIRTQFGAIVGTDYRPGLHFKLPWDQVVRFERRILTHSHTGETFLTNDNRGLTVAFYIKWRVQDASRFFQTTGGQEEIAGDRLSEIVKDGLKSVVAQRSLEQIVASERQAVTGEMFGNASREVAKLGIELVDVRVQKIDLPEDVSNRVYESMKQNFLQIAARLRAEGRKRATAIRAEADRKRAEVLAEADRTSLQIRGEADAEAAAIYSSAYSRNPEFYAFYRSLQAYERSIGKEGDVLVVTPDGEFFKYLKNSGRR